MLVLWRRSLQKEHMGRIMLFIAEKAVKDNELAKRTVKKNWTPNHLLKICAVGYTEFDFFF